MCLLSLIRWDVSTFYLINSVSSPLLNLIMLFITKLGSFSFIVILSGLIFLSSKKLEIKRIAVLILIALVIQSLIVYPIKLGVNRKRPGDALNGNSIEGVCSPCPQPKVLEPPEADPSFPSGHAGRYFLIALVLYPFRKKLKVYFYASILLGLLVSFSRVYVGVHFPMDVIFGALFGILAGWITLILDNRFAAKIDKIFRFGLSIEQKIKGKKNGKN